MNDEEILEAFAHQSIPLEEWDHHKHLRLAYLHLKQYPLEEAIDRIRDGIRTYNAAKGIEESLLSGYHETMTQTWMRLIDFTMKQHGAGEDSESFFQAQPHLTQKSLLHLYYSREHFCTEEAKRNWVDPDLAPLPLPKN